MWFACKGLMKGLFFLQTLVFGGLLCYDAKKLEWVAQGVCFFTNVGALGFIVEKCL